MFFFGYHICGEKKVCDRPL